MSHTLADFVRHAERFGTECVYETAEELEFSTLDLGYLARHLRRIDGGWRLTTEQRERLVADLLAEGVRTRKLAEMAGVSEKTVSRMRKQDGEQGVRSPESRILKPEKQDKSVVPNDLPGRDEFVHCGPAGHDDAVDRLGDGHEDRREENAGESGRAPVILS